MIRIVTAILLFMLACQSARADIINEMADIRCLPTLNVLSIALATVNGNVAQRTIEKDVAATFKATGLLYVMQLFTFDKNYTSQKAKSFHTQCVLQSTNRDGRQPHPLPLDITLTGMFDNPNPAGRCGNWRSFILTVRSGDKTYVDHVPFEEGCDSHRNIALLQINP